MDEPEKKPQHYDFQSSGIVVGDPMLGLPHGASGEFRSRLLPYSGPIGSHALADWDNFGGILMQMLVVDEDAGYKYVQGCAVCIAPGIALTAQHNFPTHLERLTRGFASLAFTSICPHGLAMWQCSEALVLSKTDLIICYITLVTALPPNNLFLFPHLTIREPKKGERITILGFVAEGDGSFHYEEPVGGKFHVGSGIVTDVFLEGRGEVYPGPSFAVWCYSLAGMSGGAAFTEDGYLMGLLSSCIECDDKEGPSFVSLHWPALFKEVHPKWPAEMTPWSGYLYQRMGLFLENKKLIVDRGNGDFSITFGRA